MMGISSSFRQYFFSRFYEQANLRKRLEMGEWWADFLGDALENEAGQMGERD